MYREIIKRELDAHLGITEKIISGMQDELHQACSLVASVLRDGKRIYLFGNGGSAADAQHIAAEFTGRYVKERKGLPAIALSTDTSALTAIGNDYGFDQVFKRQLEALAHEGDLLIGISASGNSGNVVKALEFGKGKGCRILVMTGNDGGKIAGLADVSLIVPHHTTARIQEMHILMGHIICSAIDSEY